MLPSEILRLISIETSERRKVDKKLWSRLSQEISERQIKDSIISPPPTDLSKIWSALAEEKFERQEEDKRLWTVLDAAPPIPDVANIWSALRMETSERQAEFNSIRRVPNKAWRGGHPPCIGRYLRAKSGGEESSVCNRPGRDIQDIIYI